MSKKISLSKNVIFYWDNNHFVCDNYMFQKSLSLDIRVIPILNFFTKEKNGLEITEVSRLESTEFNNSEIINIVHQLLSLKILEYNNDNNSTNIDYWSQWGKMVQYYHFGSRVTKNQVLINNEESREFLKEKNNIEAAPNMYFEYESEKEVKGKIELSTPRSMKNLKKFGDVLLERRTTREFSRKKLDKSIFSDILYYTFGATACNLDEGYGPFLYKTSPSGGSRHPIEVYPLIINVEGIKSGIYHYSVNNHNLSLVKKISEKKLRILLKEMGKDQEHVGEPSVVFLYTARIEREAWKYQSPRAYRVMMYDLGHLSQTLYLLSSYFDVGAFFTGALRDDIVEKVMEFDSLKEIPLGMSGIGHF